MNRTLTLIIPALFSFYSIQATAQSLSLVADINTNGESSIPVTSGNDLYMTKFNDSQYLLLANDGIHDNDPYVTDGTPQGTFLLHDFEKSEKSNYLF